MNESTRFRPRCPPIVHETIDGEVVLVDMHTGTYYSLIGLASAIWTGIEGSSSLEELNKALAGKYAQNPEAQECAGRFLKRLADEGLIEQAGAGVAHGTPSSEWIDQLTAAPDAFVEPEIAKFEDLQELILLDPVHEVGTAGWPHPQAPRAQAATAN